MHLLVSHEHKFDMLVFFEKTVEKIQVSLKRDKNIR
jgi:hypothetical protein